MADPTAEAVAAYQAAMAQRRRQPMLPAPSLAPWDEATWFDTPTEVQLSIPAGGPAIQLAAQDFRRVVLMIGLAPGDTMALSMQADMLFSFGAFLLGSNPPFILTQKRHGPLCQVAWFGNSSGGANPFVIEVKLRDWPRK